MQGSGSITVTTLRLDANGPVAWLLLESLIQHAVAARNPVAPSVAGAGASTRAAIAD
jgi:hypothetical protein